jgi:hypothetical protein
MAKQEGPHYRFRQFEYWAERGMITLIDENLMSSGPSREDAMQRLRPGEFMQRAIAIRMGVDDQYPSEVREAQKLLLEAKSACKLAKSQGDPTDPRTLDHMTTHRRRSSILVPGQAPALTPAEANTALGPVGGAKFKIQSKNASEVMKSGPAVVPDFTIGQQGMLTPKRANKLRKKKRRRS